MSFSTTMKHLLLPFALCIAASVSEAEVDLSHTSEETLAFVESNLLGIFYHELGHALIDVLELPIFGQEEDAADVLSIFLIDAFYEEEAAVQLAYDAAFGFLGEAEANEEIAFWDVHGPDLQRYYNTVCLFYGANPDERADLAEDLGLPEDRADYCPEEYSQAADSWGGALDEISHEGGGNTLIIGGVDAETDGGILTERVLRAEVEALNGDFRLPETLTISIQPCGEANAFYDPEYVEITMCTEFADALVEMAPDL
ncbi:DUF4344 domain-containing metallopeptidase [Shimia sp. MMG029]|uniref:DUF4344 domain-containing metallopeptidase n=1 Tax=Shimia sp. MMG029 TaxID=3021978 RepID=UPI0022FDC8C6|nr:DUF4344 domain-containing metallopeptidase [Shimia sp. MMG029]MDA5558362.1 DUF4344 domain-containing metallopeptidase [Shimia sp. MMG029]